MIKNLIIIYSASLDC